MANTSNTITLQVKVDGPLAQTAQIREDLVTTKQAARDVGVELTKALGSQATEKAAQGFKATAAGATQAKQAISGATTVTEAFRQRVDALDAALSRTDQLHQKLSQTTPALAQGFAQIGVELQRQADVLQRIRGPQEQYQNDLKSMFTMLSQGKITMREYTTELSKMNASRGAPMGGKVGSGDMLGDALKTQGPLGQLGAAVSKDGLGGLGQTAAIGAAVIAVKELVSGIKELADSYVEVSNEARKLVATGGDVDAVLTQQYDESIKLHSSLLQTIELTHRVQDATDEMNLTTKQQTELTESIGAAVRLTGRDLSQAEGLVNSLSFAFANGTITGRELKGIMKLYPEIADQLTTTMGHSRSELIKLANQGKVTGQMLVDSFTESGAALQEKLSNRAETSGEQWQHFKDELTLTVGKLIESSGVMTALGDILGAVGKTISFVTDLVKMQSDGWGVLTSKLGPVGEGLNTLLKPFGTAKMIFGTINDGLNAINNSISSGAIARSNAAKEYIAITDVMKQMGEQQNKNSEIAKVASAMDKLGIDQGDTKFNAGVADTFDAMKSGAKQFLDINLPEVFDQTRSKAVGLTAEFQKLKDQHTSEVMADEAHRLYNELNGINDLLEGQAKGLKGAAEKLQQYTDAQKKLHDQRVYIETHGTQSEANPSGFSSPLPESRDERDIRRGKRDATLELNNAEVSYGKTVVDLREKTLHQKDGLNDLTAAYKAGAITAKEYAEGFKALGIEEDRMTKIYKELTEPAKNFKLDMTATNALLATGKITAEQYTAEISKLMDAFAGKDFRDALDFASGKGAKSIQHVDHIAASQAPNSAEDDIASRTGSMRDRHAEFSDSLESGATVQTKAQFDALAKSQDDVLVKTMALEQEMKALGTVGENSLQGSIDEFDKLNSGQERVLANVAQFSEAARAPMRDYQAAIAAIGILMQSDAGHADEYRLKLQALTEAEKQHQQALAKVAHRNDPDAQVVDGMKAAGDEIRKQMDITAQSQKIVVQGFDDISTAITDLVTKGTTDWKGMIQSMLAEMTKLLLYRAAFALIGGGGGGAAAGVGGALAGFATGGMIAPGGHGGVDSQVVAFRKSPDETVRVTTPQQEARLRARVNGGGGDGRQPIVINNYTDPNAGMKSLDRRQGRNFINNTVQSNHKALVGTITRRQR